MDTKVKFMMLNLLLNDTRIEIELTKLTGESVIVYGQVDITKDMMEERAKQGLETVMKLQNVQPHNVKSDNPYITYEKDGAVYKLEAIILLVVMVSMEFLDKLFQMM